MKLQFISVILFSYCFSQAGSLPKVINFCGDGSEWPPYIYHERDASGRKTGKIVGYTQELISAILSKKKIKATFDLPPWSRCLSESKKGGAYHVAVDSSYSKKRDNEYILSKEYYSISPRIFYLKSKYPNGLKTKKQVQDLIKKGSVCGLQGYNYVGFFKGLSNEQIDRGSKDHKSVISKTKKGRCSAFLARYEIVNGFKNLGNDLLSGTGITSSQLPGVQKEKFYLLISREIGFGNELKKAMDSGIAEMKRNGKMAKLLKKYVR